MESFQDKVKRLVTQGKVRISEHGYDELAEDGLSACEALAGVSAAILIEGYPDFAKGPCALFLQ